MWRWCGGVLWMLALGAAPAWAADEEPAVDDIDRDPLVVQKPLVRALHLGALEIRLEETRLEDVWRAVGAGHIRHRGDAAGSMYWLCYTVRQTAGGERLWIVAHAEMGGPERRITELEARVLDPPAQATAACPELPAALQPVRLDFGLWLGAQHSDFAARLDLPRGGQGPALNYAYWGQVPGVLEGEAMQYDLGNGLSLRVAGGRVTGLRAWQVTTY